MAVLDDDSVLAPQPEPEGGEVGNLVVEYAPDGTIIVSDPNAPQQPPADMAFSDNLVATLDEATLTRLGSDVVEWVEADIQSRAQWIKRFKRGLELLGVKDAERTTLDIDGSSKVTHPLIGMATVEFNARAGAELMPPAGPVKATVIGKATPELEERAARVEQFMNYQVTEADQDYYDDMDQLLFALPWCGSAFKKTYFDDYEEKVISRYINARDFIVPYDAPRLSGASRYTHRYRLNEIDVAHQKSTGYLADVDFGIPNAFNEDDEFQDLINDADDREVSPALDDGRFTFYETHCYYDLGHGVCPYIVVVDKDSQKVGAVYRNWREEDAKKRRLQWFTHYKFLPGVGFYGFGFIHMIGGLASAATAALRALLDSAAAANFQGGFMAKNGMKPRGTTKLKFGQYQEIDATYEDLQKSFYTPPFKEPSNALFQLFQGIVEIGRAFTSSTEVLVGDANNNAPVGTTVALIEQSTKVFTAIHKRLHLAQRHEFRVIARINYMYLPDEYPYDVEGGSRNILREDFAPGVAVAPVSDPNIFSSTQRIAIAQAVVQMAEKFPDVVKRRQAVIRLMKAMMVPSLEEVLVPEEGPPHMDPVSENAAIMVGDPVMAYPDQDHQAHLIVVQSLIEQAQQSEDPVVQQALQPAMAHAAEHIAYAMKQSMEMMLGVPLPEEGLPPELENRLALAQAMAIKQSKGQMDSQAPPDPETLKALAEIKREDEKAMADMQAKMATAQASIAKLQASTDVIIQTASADIKRRDVLAAHEAALKSQAAREEAEQEEVRIEAELDNEQKLTDAKAKAIKTKAAQKPAPKKSGDK